MSFRSSHAQCQSNLLKTVDEKHRARKSALAKSFYVQAKKKPQIYAEPNEHAELISLLLGSIKILCVCV